MNYSAFERSGIELSFWSGEPLSPRAPFFRILVFFRGCAGACSNNRILLGFVTQGLMERYGVAFFYWSKAIEKTGFWKSIPNFCEKNFFSDLETFTFSNAFAIQNQSMYQ